jgi:D-alanyl-D-alanine carboxypeptidase (penicillin-binding protein 5/6)
MNKKRLLGLLLFSVLILGILIVSADYLVKQKVSGQGASQEVSPENTDNKSTDMAANISSEPWLSSNPSDTGEAAAVTPTKGAVTPGSKGTQHADTSTGEESSETVSTNVAPQLIYDCNKVDYQLYIPDMILDHELETALDINNPDISVDAEAAILFDAKTKEVLYYKNPVKAEFSASTVKLLTSITALELCNEEEEVTIGNEITMIATDSTKANIHKGEVLTVHNLLEGMLLPSGNDAAYALAAYVGRKSLKDPKASKEEAIIEFIRLMNEQAKKIGVKNSCFKTPDGYDAIGQYTTAYDMGLIGIAAAGYDTIVEISQKSSSRNIFVSGRDVTWENTNRLIKKGYEQYYPYAIGLKTGTSTMAGRCLIAAAQKGNKEVVCVILDSSSTGRWNDAITLLDYGLD